MKALFTFVLLYYFFGIQYLSGMTTQYGPQMTGIINIIVITVVALLYYHFKTHEQSREQVKHMGVRAYNGLRTSAEKYLFVISLVLFVLSTVAQIFWPLDVSYVGRFFAAWIICFVIVWDAFWQAKIYLGRHLFLHKESIFWLSVAVTFLLLHWTASALEDRSVLVSIYVGMMAYIVIIKWANVVRGYSIRKLFPTRLYAVAIVIALVCQGLKYYPQTFNISLETTWDKVTTLATSYRDRTTQAIETIVQPSDDVDDIFASEEVIGSGVVIEETIVVETGSIVEGVQEEAVSQAQDLDAQVTFTQALQHLFTAYQTPLSTATNVRFSKLTSTDNRYPLFKTAYEKRMIGSTVNPDGQVRCDVYMVMKGIVAGRDVKTQGNVFDTYRAAALANDEINGCERDGLVTVGNL